MMYHCPICEYAGDPGLLPCTCDLGPCPEDAPQPGCEGPTVGCPVCVDGSVDPWAMIREIRALIGSSGTLSNRPGELSPSAARSTESGPGDNGSIQLTNAFVSEWELLRISISSIWSDLATADLAVANGDRTRFEGLLRRRYGYGTTLAHQLTNGLLDLHERFNGRWDVVAECVPKYWTKISAHEVAQMDGTMRELAGLVERRYRLPRGKGRRQVVEFLNQIDYPLLVRLFRGSAGRSDGGDVATPSEDAPRRSETAG